MRRPEAAERVYDGLVREGRAAAAALGLPYPMTAAAEAELRDLLVAEWPRALPSSGATA